MVTKYLPQKGKFLDIGCGTGKALGMIDKNVFKVYGIEVSQSSIKRCRQKGIDCRLYNGKIIPYKNNFFDVAGSFNVLEHVDNPVIFLNESIRIVKKNGIIIIVCPNFLSITNSYHYRTRGISRKINNIMIMAGKLKSNGCHFEKMPIVKSEIFQVDDDAVNVTNPFDILKWSKEASLSLIFWSAKSNYKPSLSGLLDAGIFRYLMGSSFFCFQKNI